MFIFLYMTYRNIGINIILEDGIYTYTYMYQVVQVVKVVHVVQVVHVVHVVHVCHSCRGIKRAHHSRRQMCITGAAAHVAATLDIMSRTDHR